MIWSTKRKFFPVFETTIVGISHLDVFIYLLLKLET